MPKPFVVAPSGSLYEASIVGYSAFSIELKWKENEQVFRAWFVNEKNRKTKLHGVADGTHFIWR